MLWWQLISEGGVNPEVDFMNITNEVIDDEPEYEVVSINWFAKHWYWVNLYFGFLSSFLLLLC